MTHGEAKQAVNDLDRHCSSALDEWESKFVISMLQRMESGYGFTLKQIEKIKELEEKHL